MPEGCYDIDMKSRDRRFFIVFQYAA